MIHGLISTVLVGMLGGLIAELIRLAPALRLGQAPRLLETFASLIIVALGGCAALFGWDSLQSAYKVAVLGAAFPLLFTASVDGATRKRGSGGRDVAAIRRTLIDYVAGRF
jgi:hypothetical protein